MGGVDLGRGAEIGVQLYVGTIPYSLVRQLHLENLINGSVLPLDEKYLYAFRHYFIFSALFLLSPFRVLMYIHPFNLISVSLCYDPTT